MNKEKNHGTAFFQRYNPKVIQAKIFAIYFVNE